MEEELDLIDSIRGLQFQAFDFQGYRAKRRIAEFGLEYNFSTRNASGAADLPGFLLPLRDRAAAFAGIAPAEIAESIVTEYPPSAPMGWHRDVPQFETIIGISLAGQGWMRLKPYKAPGKVLSLLLKPRSIYVMSGESRWGWQHSIVAVESLRYSITFRTLRARSTSR
ncbi:MAG TPA: alpha-ketoglutarate-dependent dioxygenase AlkB [Acidisarcina sp.]